MTGAVSGAAVDLGVAVVVGWQMLSGYRRGLLLVLAGPLASVAAVVAAWWGAPILTRRWPLANLEPGLAAWLQRRIEAFAAQRTPGAAAAPSGHVVAGTVATGLAENALAIFAGLIIGFFAQLVIQRLAAAGTRLAQALPFAGTINSGAGAAVTLSTSVLLLSLIALGLVTTADPLHTTALAGVVRQAWAGHALAGLGSQVVREISVHWTAIAHRAESAAAQLSSSTAMTL